MKWFLLLVTVAFVQYHGIKGLPLSDYDHTERQDENSDALLEEMENDDLFKSHTNVAKIVKRESDPGVFRFKPIRFRSYAGSRLKNAGSRLKNFGNRLKNIGKKTSPNIGKTVSPNIGYTGLPSIGNTVSPKLSLLQKLEYLAPLSHVTRLGTDIFHFVHLVKEVEAREQEREILKKEHDNKDKTEGVEAREQEKEMPKKEECKFLKDIYI
ncbi:PREDICTED: uncharacterized protein LOC105570103 [Vollenhovia emeryi]|uniref:uncharacterized protein LOC105570103 n=1 Tax=Vollenhovia emeryi TaxID=411798 RepID=UPI0005F3F421|nr:PREDICTED: uncharacterized protein LOC105570103 [Vollenhovia emeryi]